MNISRRKFLIFAVFVVVLFSSLGALYWNSLLSPMAYREEAKEIGVYIPENSSSSRIGQILYQSGLVRVPELAPLYARIHGLEHKLKPGRYLLKTDQSVPEIISLLVSGPKDVVVFTMPEGFNLNKLTDLLLQKGLVQRDKFKSALSQPTKYNYPFLKEIPKGLGLEGYLFPDTYHAGFKTGEEQIITMMLNRFELEIKDLDYEKKARQKNLTLHQAVTIASMIEGEAAVDGERPIIASVIYNRLRLGMPLQIDATVKFALGGNKKVIYYKDLEVNSPYNTYRIKGLPPGPINSPGRASLLAAVNPAKTNYLYYVAKPDGTHAFSTTLEEHNKNKARYQ